MPCVAPNIPSTRAYICKAEICIGPRSYGGLVGWGANGYGMRCRPGHHVRDPGHRWMWIGISGQNEVVWSSGKQKLHREMAFTRPVKA